MANGSHFVINLISVLHLKAAWKSTFVCKSVQIFRVKPIDPNEVVHRHIFSSFWENMFLNVHQMAEMSYLDYCRKAGV